MQIIRIEPIHFKGVPVVVQNFKNRIMKFKTIKILLGWIIFFISLTIYILTIEPANSLWDCSEFIACAYKLQVSHSPGAPLFIMIGRLFSLLAGNQPQKVAVMVNLFSALSSALTIMFLFWTITILVEKALPKNDQPDKKQIILVMAAGFISSLSFAFTDSFWFSAVEAEVYAFSSFLTALVFWAILKWEKQSDPIYASRWLIFIAFILTISIGVHLLNLLAIPAILFVFISNNKPVNRKLILLSLLLSVIALGFMMYIFIPGIAKIASYVDLFCVNSFHLPLNTGLYLFFILMGTILVILLLKAIRKSNIIRQTIVLSLIFMLTGYTCYLSILFRSQENISIDMDNPDNPFSLCNFLNREHYGSRPLVYGPYYNAPVTGVKKRFTFSFENGRYIRTDLNPTYTYDKRFLTLFPRMSDNSPRYMEAYKYWGKIKGENIQIDTNGKSETILKPTSLENLRYFFRYQLGYMYWRYFFWNFAGRQDDAQGLGNAFHGNWISGINFIDRLRLSTQNNLPPSITENKARNTYFFLPLILGILGAIWHYRNHRKGFITIILLFLFTGMAISVYLNEVPVTPRERDYVYVGSFYAFAVWIGMGIIAVFSFLKKYLTAIPSLSISLVAGIIVPTILFCQNYDDHNRSNRFAARDFGSDYLNSCRKNAILFSNGDNDTYPLWYAQEVESVRTDVRAVLQPYLGAEWYIDQMRKGINKAEALPISFPPEKFYNGQREVIYIVNRIDSSVEIHDALEFIKSDNPRTKLMMNDSNHRDYLPAHKLKITIDKDALRKSGQFTEDEITRTEDAVYFSINKSYLLRSDLILLDIIAQNNWERPLCFLSPVELKNLGLERYLVKEGFAYRLVPYPAKELNSVYGYPMNIEATYKKLMKEFRWGNLNHRGVYADNTIRTQLQVMGIRRTFAQLADALIQNNQKNRAVTVLNKCMEIMPLWLDSEDYFITRMLSQYFEAGDNEKGLKLINDYALILDKELSYFKTTDKTVKRTGREEYRNYLYYLNQLLGIADSNGLSAFQKEYNEKFKNFYDDFMQVK